MPEVVSDTSPLQYLHQIGLLQILPALVERIVVPPAVDQELSIGRALGVNLPDLSKLGWMEIRSPSSRPALPFAQDLGPGETETLMLALESPESTALLDDSLARRVAEILKIRFSGTLGLLLDAKSAGLISDLEPLLARLQALGFRLAPHTRLTILRRLERRQARRSAESRSRLDSAAPYNTQAWPPIRWAARCLRIVERALRIGLGIKGASHRYEVVPEPSALFPSFPRCHPEQAAHSSS